MKKISILLLLVCSVFHRSNAVEFMHSIGAGPLIAFNNSDAATAGVIFYAPRINFLDKGGMVLSAGSNVGLGFSGNSITGSSFTLQLPLLVEANFGHAANKDADQRFGGFGGLGFNYILTGDTDNGSIAYYGPTVNGGFRFGFKERSAGIRLAYTYDLNISANIIGASIFYTFGRF